MQVGVITGGIRWGTDSMIERVLGETTGIGGISGAVWKPSTRETPWDL